MNRLSVPTSPLGGRRGKATLFNRGKTHPAAIAPAGSSWSSHGDDEMGEAPRYSVSRIGEPRHLLWVTGLNRSRDGLRQQSARRWPGFRADRQAIHPDYRERE